MITKALTATLGSLALACTANAQDLTHSAPAQDHPVFILRPVGIIPRGPDGVLRQQIDIRRGAAQIDLRRARAFDDMLRIAIARRGIAPVGVGVRRRKPRRRGPLTLSLSRGRGWYACVPGEGNQSGGMSPPVYCAVKAR
mgnify:CR=1 FL=1